MEEENRVQGSIVNIAEAAAAVGDQPHRVANTLYPP
jgi:hypothetical protein